MKLIKPSYQILSNLDPIYLTQLIELAGRTCYKSEHKITENSSKHFIAMLLNRQHESVIEHVGMTVKFIIDRGVSHELVRHRLASFSQESTRYCNYSKDNFNNELTFIIPPWLGESTETLDSYFNNQEAELSNSTSAWIASLLLAEASYLKLLSLGWKPEQARSVLPNSLKTEIVVTANFREWRTIFKQRTASTAHPQMREIMVPLLLEVNSIVPVVFEDIANDIKHK